MASVADEVAEGGIVDGFRIGRCVHSGAMGRMFEVTSDNAAAPMLMKVPRFGAVDSNELLIAFETEAMVLQRLRGTWTPRFVAAGDVTRVPYLVTERIDAGSLDRRANAVLATEELAATGSAIADALHAIHVQGVVHHDLKPDNVIVANGRAVLLDFGLACHRDLPDLLAEERRFTAGSAPYVSPEQVRGIRGDTRSDLFALGVVLYELGTGELPFGAPRTAAGLRDRLWREPAPPRAIAKELAPWLQEVILRCLEVDPDTRYQAAAHVAFDLRHPEQVALTARSRKVGAEGFMGQVVRWWKARENAFDPASPSMRENNAHVVMVAVDTMHPEDLRQPELQRETRRMLSIGGEYRLICVSVIPAAANDGEGRLDGPTEHRIRLRHWVDPLRVPADRMSLHVLEAADPASALIEFARANNVDLIVLGAPAAADKTFAWWRSVASSVTANADCTVHVVRRPV